MPAKIDLSLITFNGREVQDLSEVFYEAAFLTPGLQQFHTIVQGIKAKQQIITLGDLGLSGKKIVDCAITPNPNQIPSSTKTWNPEYIGDRFKECFVNLFDTFLVYALKDGVRKPDLTNTDWANFLESRVGKAAQEAVLRLAWLGNVTADNIADGGVLTAGTPPEYFNAITGFWPQLLAIVASDSSKRVTIAENAGASFAAQQFDAADRTNGTATGYFESMIYGADMRLRGASNQIIIATQSLVDQYARERKAVANIDLAYNRVENGISTLTIDGVEIIPFQFLDRMIRTYENNGTKWNNPHRAVLTTRDNLQIGTEQAGNFGELDPFYDKVAKEYIVDYAFNLDAKVALDHMVMVAY